MYRLLFLGLFIVVSSCGNNQDACKERDVSGNSRVRQLIKTYFEANSYDYADDPQVEVKLKIIDEIQYIRRIIEEKSGGYDPETFDLVNGCEPIELVKEDIDNRYNNHLKPLLNQLVEESESSNEFRKWVTGFFENDIENNTDYASISRYNRNLSNLLVSIMLMDLSIRYRELTAPKKGN